MAPLTRFRGNNKHTHTDLAVEHYAARASVPGTLIISEATFIAHKASGNTFNGPGIWSDEQIAAWKRVRPIPRPSSSNALTLATCQVTDAVHAKGSYMYLQIWALGRTASPEQLKGEDPSFEYVSAGSVPLPTSTDNDATPPPTPRPLTKAEIAEYVQLYATAARNAVERAGFDGVEVHGANGFLIDQFLKETSNDRTDEYGGSPENRARFALEVVAAVSAAVGEERVGLRLSPWLTLYGAFSFSFSPRRLEELTAFYPTPHQIHRVATPSQRTRISSRRYADATQISDTCTLLSRAFRARATAPIAPLSRSRMTSCGRFG